MSEAERLHYSRDHWEKQFNDCINNSLVYEARVERGEIASASRIQEVLASQRDRIFYAYVNGCKMSNDPLRISGLSFGVMLDDVKRKLLAQVDDQFKKQGYIDKLKAAITEQYFSMRATQLYYKYVSASSFAGLHYYGTDFGFGRDETVIHEIRYYQPGRRFGKTARAEGLEKGEGVLDYYDAIAQYRQDHGYYDPWYIKAWKKFERWVEYWLP